MIFKCLRHGERCLPPWWIRYTQNYALPLVIVIAVLSVGVLAYTVSSFKIDTDINDMISSELPFRKTYKDYKKALPILHKRLIVVVDALSPEMALNVRKELATRLKEEKQLFILKFVD